jgi:hypothetical protein
LQRGYERSFETSLREAAVRTGLIVVVMAILVAVPAHAQGKHRASNELAGNTDKDKQRKANEAAAKAAMDRIPDSKVKYDPWQSAR